jgi:deoxyribodipyrimidine photo-lyase
VIEPQRLTELNGDPERAGDYVLYWMQQSQRAAFNPALEAAIAAGNRLGLPVLVGFGLTDLYPEANARHYAFMLEGLAETARNLQARGIAFVIRHGTPDEVAVTLANRAAMVVCDRGYLRPQKQWRSRVAADAKRRVLQVEGDVVVPVDMVSKKPEIGARTLRPKLLRLREDFLHPLACERPSIPPNQLELRSDVDLSNIPALIAQLRIDRSIAPVSAFRGGETEARRRLRGFVAHRLDQYAAARAHLGEPQVSTLSPYLHFGQISPVEIALAVREAKTDANDRASYLDELVIRRELSTNFVNCEPRYDRYDALPDWARRTLAAHRTDWRQHLYDYGELAQAETHDPYWNAAMREMLATGYMHNHMRMYWGKKVLEWSLSPEDGYATLVRLNNTYFLDGRDANSYANVGWVFGLHDRPWPERPIFGTVRYMNAAGLKRKTDIEAYVRRVAAQAGEENAKLAADCYAGG